MKFTLPKTSIDWPNHLIGFFSALFGILIAFELDSWRERRNQEEVVAQAFDRLKTEISINQNSLHSNVAINLRKIAVLKRLADKLSDNLLFMGSKPEADSINQFFHGLILIEEDERKEGKRPVHITTSTLVMGPNHTSAWESAKATGVLNFMGYERVLTLSSIYNFSTLAEEQNLIRQLTRKADEITTKAQLIYFLTELEESYQVIHRELQEYDQFVNILGIAE